SLTKNNGKPSAPLSSSGHFIGIPLFKPLKCLGELRELLGINRRTFTTSSADLKHHMT
nr:hypothetical protein [Tanacetum cinerariifolium]